MVFLSVRLIFFICPFILIISAFSLTFTFVDLQSTNKQVFLTGQTTLLLMIFNQNCTSVPDAAGHSQMMLEFGRSSGLDLPVNSEPSSETTR